MDRVAKIRLPETVLFQDYSGIAVAGGRIAVVSQESSALWVGSLAPDGWEVTDAGMCYALPRWLTAASSTGRPRACHGSHRITWSWSRTRPNQIRIADAGPRSRWIHIFRIPASGR